MRLRRIWGIGAGIVIALGAAVPAQAGPMCGLFDTARQETPEARDLDGWHTWGVVTERAPLPPAPGSVAPSPPTSVKLGMPAQCSKCTPSVGNLLRVVRTRPGCPITVTLLAARDAGFSQIGVFGYAQDSPDLTPFDQEGQPIGGGLKSMPESPAGTLLWKSYSWTLYPTSDYTKIQILEGPFFQTWVDDIVIRCGR